jgi:tight adherence protein C
MLIGAAVLSGRSAKRKTLQRRLDDLRIQYQPPGAAAQKPKLTGVLAWIGKRLSPGGPSSGLREQLAKAGYHASSAGTVYLGAKFSLLALGLAAGGVLVPAQVIPQHLKWVIIVAGAVVLYFVPNFFIRMRRAKRTGEVRRHLPDVVDLLEICVVSGMGLDMAWNAVTDDIRRVSTTLADEMALTNLEIHLGAPRAVAMRHMAERTGVDELTSLVALLLQADRFGTSISDTLKVFAQSMREERGQTAQEAAEKMAVKLLFPMVLFIFPAVLIVLAGPAAIQLFKAMSER